MRAEVEGCITVAAIKDQLTQPTGERPPQKAASLQLHVLLGWSPTTRREATSTIIAVIAEADSEPELLERILRPRGRRKSYWPRFS